MRKISWLIVAGLVLLAVTIGLYGEKIREIGRVKKALAASCPDGMVYDSYFGACVPSDEDDDDGPGPGGGGGGGGRPCGSVRINPSNVVLANSTVSFDFNIKTDDGTKDGSFNQSFSDPEKNVTVNGGNKTVTCGGDSKTVSLKTNVDVIALKPPIEGPDKVLTGSSVQYGVKTKPAGFGGHVQWEKDGSAGGGAGSYYPNFQTGGKHKISAYVKAGGNKGSKATKSVKAIKIKVDYTKPPGDLYKNNTYTFKYTIEDKSGNQLSDPDAKGKFDWLASRAGKKVKVSGPVVEISVGGVSGQVPLKTTVAVKEPKFEVEVYEGPEEVVLGQSAKFKYRIKDLKSSAKGKVIKKGKYSWAAKNGGLGEAKAVGPSVTFNYHGSKQTATPSESVTVVGLVGIEGPSHAAPGEKVTLKGKTNSEFKKSAPASVVWELSGGATHSGPKATTSMPASGNLTVQAYLKGAKDRKVSHTVISKAKGEPWVEFVKGPDAMEFGTKAPFAFKIHYKGEVVHADVIEYHAGTVGAGLRTLTTVTNWNNEKKDEDPVKVQKHLNVVEFAGVDKDAVPQGKNVKIYGKTKPAGYANKIHWFQAGKSMGQGRTLDIRFQSPGTKQITGRVLLEGALSTGKSVSVDAVEPKDISPKKVPVGEKKTFSATTQPTGHASLVQWNAKKVGAEYEKKFKSKGKHTINTAIKAGGVVGPETPFEIEALVLKKPEKFDASKKLVDFLKNEEKLRKTMYDSDGGTNCTIGYGHLIHYKKCGAKPKLEKKFKGGITEKKAMKLLKKDIKDKAEKYINNYVSVKLTQYQFDAISSLIFNAGSGNFKDSNLRELINKGASSKKIKQEIKSYKISAPGHPSRRKREAKMYSGGDI